jgi:hypothetical protein
MSDSRESVYKTQDEAARFGDRNRRVRYVYSKLENRMGDNREDIHIREQ